MKLPDWKKIELKMTQSKFNSYPIQTEEQEYNRRISILNICAYFAMTDFDSFVDSLSQNSLDGIWPLAMELFVTPRLLDNKIVPYKELLTFGRCYCCENFGGHNDIYQPKLRNKKLIPLYGICMNTKDSKRFSGILSRVRPQQRCISWNPLKIYEQVIDFRIKKLFEKKYTSYRYEDYMIDLRTIDIWDFFQNKYKLKG